MSSIFDDGAELYDEIRPGYPAELYDDLLRALAVPAGGRVLEVGCGTGQATVEFARRGFRIQCLDPGARLVEYARRRCAAYPEVSFTVSRLEGWTPEEAAFDLAASATAWHWVDPERGYEIVHRALKPGGGIALFWNLHPTPYTGFFVDVQRVYREVTPEWRTPAEAPTTSEVIEGRLRALESSRLFGATEAHAYPWSRSYSSLDYVKLLDTYSDHRSLPEEKRRRLYAGVRRLIDEEYGGSVERPYLSALFTGRRL